MKKIWTILFGEFNYTAPYWFSRLVIYFLKTRIGLWLKNFLSLKKAEPKIFYKKLLILVFGFLVFSTASVVSYQKLTNWWAQRTQPKLVTFKVKNPSVLILEQAEPDSLYIDFSQSVARLEDLNKPIVDKIKIKPEMNGVWSWKNDQTLQFKPDVKSKSYWKIGTEYDYSFSKSLFADHVKLETREGSFKTDALQISSTSSEFFIDPKDPKIKKALFHIYFSHPVMVDDVKSKLKLNIGSESGIGVSHQLNYHIQFDRNQMAAHLSSEPLTIDDRPQTARIHLEKGYKPKQAGEPAAKEVEEKLFIPGRLTAMKIESVDMQVVRNQKYEPEQVIIVRTSIDTASQEVAKSLRIKLLPLNKPSDSFNKEIKNYPWNSSSEVTEDILKISNDIQFEAIPSEQEFTKIHSFKIKTNPDRFILVEVGSGLKSLGEFILSEAYSNVVQIKPYPEEISIMSEGSLLTLSGDLKLPLMARNARQVEINVSRVIPEQVNHILSQVSYDIRKPYIDRSLLNLMTENFSVTVPLQFESAQATQFFSFDLASYLHKSSAPKGIFYVEASVIHPDKTKGPSDYRLIMVTDLGLLVKETSSKLNEVFVQNLRTGQAVKNGQVEVIGRNGLSLMTMALDSEGHVTIPDLKDFKNEKQAIAFSVKSGADQSYLPFRNYEQNLKYSRFDVGGLYENASSDQMTAFIFSDRGIYRPGEAVHLGLIARSKSSKNKNQKIPLEWSVTDSAGHLVTKEKISLNADDYKSLDFKTDSTAPVGVYDITLNLIKKDESRQFIAHQSVRVEEFQPDKLKIRTSLALEKQIGWVKNQDMSGFVNIRNLFGAAAENKVVKAKMVLSPIQPQFKGYQDYKFTEFDYKDIQLQKEDLPDQKTNEKGEASFELKLKAYNASYFLVRLDVEGFEAEAGKSVKASSSTIVSSLDFLVGAKADGDLDYIKKGAERSLNLIALNSDLQKMSAKNLTYQIIERKYVSVLTQSVESAGEYKYQSVLKQNVLKTEPLAISVSGQNFKIDTSVAGDFFFVVKNSDQMELLRLPYTVAGEANLARSLDRHAELQVILNKKDFKNGEEIEMQIKAPYTGAGLISIERDNVYQHKWFKTETSASVQKIKVPEGLTGNAYVTVTFLRAIDSKEIFMSPLSYAVVPFSISLQDKKTEIHLKTADRIKPGQKLKVEYSTNNPTDLILYGVDEGILQVAKYNVPEPVGYFFQKRALQVNTFQMLDLLMPEFKLLQQSQAAGGDEAYGAIGKNLNPFKSKRTPPVVFWSGVIKADSKTRFFTYDVPDYFNGSIKVIAVAANSQKLGSASTTVFVRGDLILSTSLPTFVAPLDEFKVSIAVANQKEKSGDQAEITVSSLPNNLFNLKSPNDLKLKIPEGREGSASFSFQVKDQLADAQMRFQAQHEKTTVVSKSDISIRPATPYMNFVQFDLTDKNNFELKKETLFYSAFAKSNFSTSYTPLALGFGLQSYLESYPYGCTEQLISRMTPALFMPKKQKEDLKSLIRVLRSRQTADGGFSLYEQAGAASYRPASLYAIQFLLDVQQKQLADVSDLLRKAKSYLQQIQIADGTGSIESYRAWAAALYLSAEMKVVNGASLNALKQELNTQFKQAWLKDVTAAYLAATYKLYKQDEESEKLFNKIRLADSFKPEDGATQNLPYELDYFDQLSRDAVVLEMAALYAGGSLSEIASEALIKKLMTQLMNQSYQSFSAAQLIRAMIAFEERSQKKELNIQLKYFVDKKWESLLAKENSKNSVGLTSFKSLKLFDVPIQAESVQIENTKNDLFFYSYQNSGFPLIEHLKPLKNNLEVSRQYLSADGKLLDLKKPVKLGDEIKVVLSVRSIDQKAHSHVAVVDLIPGGFELVMQKDLNQLDGVNATDSIQENPSEIPEDGDTDSSGDEGALFKKSDINTTVKKEKSFDSKWFSLLVQKAIAQNQSSANLKQLYTQFIDQREDRLVIYATVTPDLGTVEYKIKAISEGKFRVPPAFAEGMYDKQLKFIGDSDWIEVK